MARKKPPEAKRNPFCLRRLSAGPAGRSQERSGAEWNFAKEFYAMVATATGEASPLM